MLRLVSIMLFFNVTDEHLMLFAFIARLSPRTLQAIYCNASSG